MLSGPETNITFNDSYGSSFCAQSVCFEVASKQMSEVKRTPQFFVRQCGLIPPPLYGMVEENVHRSGQPTRANFAFLEQLKLKTVIYLSPDSLDPAFRDFLRDENIRFIHLGADKNTAPWAPISEETVLEALSYILNVSHHPLLVLDHSLDRTGVVFGCFRKVQGWALTSLVEEYRRYAGNKAKVQNEQFVELFDVDLVRVPSNPPVWFKTFNS